MGRGNHDVKTIAIGQKDESPLSVLSSDQKSRHRKMEHC